MPTNIFLSHQNWFPNAFSSNRKWYKANREDNDEEDLNDERRSIIYALNHYDELGLIEEPFA
ncbi:MAG: hypothetical protein ACLR6J_14370 [Parabacteroides merdae]